MGDRSQKAINVRNGGSYHRNQSIDLQSIDLHELRHERVEVTIISIITLCNVISKEGSIFQSHC